MAKAITSYQSKDGKIFATEQEADLHDNRADFIHEYDFREDGLLFTANSSGKVEGYALADWIIHNKKHVMALIGTDLATIAATFPEKYMEHVTTDMLREYT